MGLGRTRTEGQRVFLKQRAKPESYAESSLRSGVE